MKIDDLVPNKSNPRKMSAQRKKDLKASLEEYGDLSKITYNVQEKSLIGGHQRREQLKGAKIVITDKFNPPTGCGTVAEGYAEKNGERYSYREVDWTPEKAAKALLIANKLQGEWDGDLIRMYVKDKNLTSVALKMAGFEDMDFKNFDIPFDIPSASTIVKDAVEQTDEQYVASTPETTEQVPVQSFNSINENTNIENKRFVIIIDCPNQDIKDSLKEKLQPEINQAGCKIF